MSNITDLHRHLGDWLYSILGTTEKKALCFAHRLPAVTAHLALPCGTVMMLAGSRLAHAEEDTGPFSSSSFLAWKPEHYLVAGFCVLGLIIVILEFVLFFRARERVSANEIMRTFSTTLILIAVVALLGIGYNQTQVQPALGLFGTLLGYLMGRGEALHNPKSEPAPREALVSRAPEG